VLVGLRPQQVMFAEQPSDQAITTTVYAHEMVGREQQLMLALETDKIRCRLSQPIQVKVGDTIWLRLVLDDAKLFDAASGRALSDRRCQSKSD
jgi:ABC-type sugar transport system ATPase subunit